ncbi:hypothetical protein FACS189490_04490 [Clostridia bacterium]|nr:hypothetical protein FACS189490_04490 [Clostridia bacterium]
MDQWQMFASLSGLSVTCVDIGEKIKLIKNGISPIYEVDLEELMRKNYTVGRFNYTTACYCYSKLRQNR